MEKIKAIWEQLPKTVRVFVYLAVSIILSELLIELANLEQTLVVRLLAQIINLAIVFLEDTVPVVRERLLALKSK